MSVASARTDGADAGRWRVAVLEDAGEYLAVDGRGSQQQVAGRLLNVCDGVLGQAMRMLVLITTNEPLTRLDDALRRPGRQLADVRFGLLDRREIASWCAARSLRPPDRESATLADLYAYASGARMPAPTQRLGFTAAGE
jgi:ATP-dependent 26S proteasome regulatory subunit